MSIFQQGLAGYVVYLHDLEGARGLLLIAATGHMSLLSNDNDPVYWEVIPILTEGEQRVRQLQVIRHRCGKAQKITFKDSAFVLQDSLKNVALRLNLPLLSTGHSAVE